MLHRAKAVVSINNTAAYQLEGLTCQDEGDDEPQSQRDRDAGNGTGAHAPAAAGGRRDDCARGWRRRPACNKLRVLGWRGGLVCCMSFGVFWRSGVHTNGLHMLRC